MKLYFLYILCVLDFKLLHGFGFSLEKVENLDLVCTILIKLNIIRVSELFIKQVSLGSAAQAH